MTFDKLAYVDRLKAAGFDGDKARAMAEGLDVALREEIVTKSELRAQFAEFKTEVKSEVAVLRWMSGAILSLTLIIFAKLFFGH